MKCEIEEFNGCVEIRFFYKQGENVYQLSGEEYNALLNKMSGIFTSTNRQGDEITPDCDRCKWVRFERCFVRFPNCEFEPA